MFTRCDLRLLNRKTLISVYPYWLDTIGLVYLGLLQALVVVPVLVQSCLDASLATIVEVKDSLRASPRVLSPYCYFSSRPTSRSSLALVPLVVRSAPPDSRGPAGSTFGGGHSTPSYRLSAYVPHDPRVVSFSGPACPSFFICILRRPRAECLPFALLHLCITMSLHDCFYGSCRLCDVREDHAF